MLRKNTHNDIIEAIFLQHGPAIERFLYNLVRNSHDAEDLFADTIVRTIEYMNAYEKIPEKAYIYTIAKHLAIDFLRRKKRLTLSFEEDLLLEIEDNVSIEDTVIEGIQRSKIIKFIEDLDYPYSVVFGLRFIDGLSFKEMNQVLDLNENHLRQVYYRAKKKIKERLLKEMTR